MFRTTVKFALFLVGGHLFLGLILIITEVFHGINDQDPSFALWLLVLVLNQPTCWLFISLGAPITPIPVVLTGVFQWAVLAFILSGVYCAIKSMFRVNPLPEKQTSRQVNGGNI